MNAPKERNIPSGTSPLAGPTLTPKVRPLKVGGRMGEEDQAEHQPEDQEQEQEGAPSAPGPRRPGRSRGGRRPAPAVKDAVAHTVRLDPEEVRREGAVLDRERFDRVAAAVREHS